VIAFIVNGAQGDDDEAHAGHFGVVTGRIADDGDIGDWLVTNFYTLDSESEKGIIAAPVTLDNYLADLNSGQAYYRPSYLLVAVLAQDRAATLVQSAFARVYSQFYRHQLVYYHPTTNCTSISVDTLRALDFAVPARGPTSRLLGWGGFPLLTAKERSIEKAKLAFDYLTVDRTRLMPAAAIEDIFDGLVALGRGTAKDRSSDRSLGHMLAEDIDALAFLRIPQIPSSRAWGDAPVLDIREYRARLPRDRSRMQIVPVPARPFPDALRDADLQPPPVHPSRLAAIVWGTLLFFAVPAVIVVLATLMAGCAANDTSTKPALPPITPIMVPPTMASRDDPTLAGRVWIWQSTALRGERIVPDAPERYTLEFESDGRVRVLADCNRGGAGYTARADRSLSITPVATTKMGCPQGSRGTEFARQLADADHYDLVDGNLVLKLKSNGGEMRFAPAAKEPK
jgi:heat shock protein HslJ